MTSRASLIRVGVVATSVAVVGLAACDEPNRFTGPGLDGGGGGAPGAPVVTIDSVPTTAPVGDSVKVRATARDDQGIVSMTFVGRSVEGDVNLGTDEVIVRFDAKTVQLASAPSDTTLRRFLQPTGGGARDTTWLVVEATDADGNVGADSARVIVGGPAVEFVNLPEPVAGQALQLTVNARDEQGVSLVRIDVDGAVQTTLERTYAPAETPVTFDTTLFIPQSASGSLEISATAVNTRGESGFTATRSLAIIQGGGADAAPPSAAMAVDSDERLEVNGEMTVRLTGSDNAGGSGIRTAGVTVLAISPSRGDTLLRESTVSFSQPRSGTVTQDFSFTPFNVDSLSIPDTLVFEVTGYFTDDAGNCGATVGAEESSLPCTTLSVGGSTGTVAQTVPGLRLEREIVAGETVLLPTGGQVMDAAVDTVRRNLFLSNIDRNRVEVFRLPTKEFGAAIGVGSAPWGLAMVNDFVLPDPDSMVVANSNGTNLEMVDLDLEQARPEERFFFPDVILWQVNIEQGEAGLLVSVTPTPDLGNLLFSDRPQYIAVDTFGNRIFSTVSVEGLPEIGTVRKSFFLDGWEQPETKIFVEHATFEEGQDAFALAHVDNVFATGTVVTIVDHEPGFPDNQIVVEVDLAFEPISTVANELAASGSDAFFHNGSWNFGSLGFQDTTFVSASGDGTLVAIGEGALASQARVLLHQAGPSFETNLTGSVPVADLITNRPGPVRGIGLNYDGTLGVVRGDAEVAFFDSGLRKQGGVELPGGAGATLHPLHANQKTLFNLGGIHQPDTHLAFVGSGDGSVDIIDTFRFLRIGSIRIRDVVSGPLRAVLPFPSDNADFNCGVPLAVTDKRGAVIGQAVPIYTGGDFNSPAPSSQVDDRCVVVKLFAVTDAGGVVVIDVRKADVLRLHPKR